MMENNKEYFTMSEENEAHPNQEQAQGIKVCGCVVLKEGYALPQFLVLLLGAFSSYYAMITAILFLVLLLSSEDYYHLDKEESAQTVSFIVLATQAVNIVVLIFIGLLYDTVGRKPILVAGNIIAAVSIVCMPYSGSVFPGLLLSRCGVTASTSALTGGPLLVDYVHNKSKGIALALLSLVAGMSGILITVVELKLAQFYKLEVFFYPPSAICLLTAVALMFWLKEPLQIQRDSSGPCCESLSQKCSLLSREARTREIWVSMVCNFLVKALDVFTGTLCTLWYEYNIFHQDTKATSGFMNKYLGAASICSLLLTFFLGFLVDRTNYRRLVPPVFFSAFFSLLLTYLADSMTSTGMTVLLGIGSTLIMSLNPTVTWLLARNVRSSAKGTVFGVYHLSGAVGLLFFGITGALLVNSSGGKGIFLLSSLVALTGGLVSMTLWSRKD